MKDNDAIDLYIGEISKLLPYPSPVKQVKLAELRVDVQAAVEDSGIDDPSTAFGSPRDVAKKFSQSQDWGTERASWWSRFFAWLIDSLFLLLFVIAYGLGGMIYILTLFVPAEEIIDLFVELWRNNEPVAYQLDLSLDETALFLVLLFVLLGTIFAVYLSYTVALERYFSATIGKKLLKLSVVDVSGIRITWYQAIIRNLSKISGGFLPIDLIIGMILEKQDPSKTRKQRGLDILAETIVVKQKSVAET
ncbi:MAG: RDD family protein [Candidatus Odinarchaeota archaeon]